MTMENYNEKKSELEYLITYNERIHCPHVAAKWRRELNRLKRLHKEEEDGRTTDD